MCPADSYCLQKQCASKNLCSISAIRSEESFRHICFWQICIGEQEALAATLQFFEERFGKLEGLEYYQERRLKGLGLLDEEGRYGSAP